MTTSVRIGISADANFSAAENAAKAAARNIDQALSGNRQASAGSSYTDSLRAAAAVEDHLRRIQAGRQRDELSHVRELNREIRALGVNYERVMHVRGGRDIFERAQRSGQDLGQPARWDWSQMYGGDAMASARARSSFESIFNPQRQHVDGIGAGHSQQPSSGIGSSAASLAQLAAQQAIGASGAGAALQGGLMARSAAAVGGLGAGAAIGVGALGAGVVLAGKGLMDGYREHLRTIESVDAQYKAIGSSDGFDGLMERTRELAGALQQTQSEAAALAAQFISVANASSSEQALRQTAFAGQFGRMFGMQPGQSAMLFARAQRAGVGDTDQEMSRFAITLSQTIQGSGMNAQAGQLMEQMVSYLEGIEHTLGRQATSDESDQYSQMMMRLYGPDGQMSVGAASNMLRQISGVDEGDNPGAVSLAYSAYGKELNFDYWRIKEFQEAGLTSSPRDLYGEGFSRDPKWLMIGRYIDSITPKDGAFGQGAGQTENMAAMWQMFTGRSFASGKHFARMYEEVKAGKLTPFDATRQLAETPVDTHRRAETDLLNSQADLAEGLMPAIDAVKQGFADATGAVDSFSESAWKAALSLSGIVDVLGLQSGDRQSLLDAMGALRRTAGSVASGALNAVVPAAGASTLGGSSRFSQLADQLADERGIDKAFYRRLIGVESGWDTNAVSHKGARGLGQLMPGTAKNPGYGVRPLQNDTPEENMRLSADYFAAMLKEFGGDYALAAAAYNAGPGAVKKHGGVPPYEETRNYVKKLMTEQPPRPVSGLKIDDMSDPSFHYGKSASANAQPFRGIVMHHTRRDSSHDAEWYVKYGQRVDEGRGGAFGYHYYIDRDGQVIQGAPMGKRTNHINPTRDVGLGNRNAIGISLIGAEGGNETPQQLASANALGLQLMQQYGISANSVYGHGEIQGNRQETEGVKAARMLRNAAQNIHQQRSAMHKLHPGIDAFNNNFYRIPPGGTREEENMYSQPPTLSEAEQRARQAAAQAAISASADLNVNINTLNRDGYREQRRFTLAVAEPRVPGSPDERKSWTYDLGVA